MSIDTSNDRALLKDVDNIVDRGRDATDVIDQIVALLHDRVSHYNWVGVYVLDGDELVLGPFRGTPSPHTRISLTSGICGAAALHQKTIIVPDVNADPRYLACSLETKSEIVVPIMDGPNCLGEIDIDSDQHDAFSDADRLFLEAVAARIVPAMTERQERPFS